MSTANRCPLCGAPGYTHEAGGMQQTKRLWTADDVAEYLQVHRETVYQMPIPFTQIGGRRRRYDPADVRRYQERNRNRRRGRK